VQALVKTPCSIRLGDLSLPIYVLVGAFETLPDNAGEVFVDNETLGRMPCYGSLYDVSIDSYDLH
jgi:hypothetical protein